MDQRLSITYSTPSDREGVVAEIWERDAQVAEICADRGYLVIEVYAHTGGQPWKFKLEDFNQILAEAVRGLGRGEAQGKDKEIESLRRQVDRLQKVRAQELVDDRRALLSAVK